MEEKQKTQVVFNFDRSDFDGVLFVMGQEKTEETENTWEALAEEPVVVDWSLLEENGQAAKYMVMSIAILAVKELVKNKPKNNENN